MDHYNNEIDDLERRLSTLREEDQHHTDEDMLPPRSGSIPGVSQMSTEVELEELKERQPSIS